MRRHLHICITSHSEVMFRDEEDYLRGINCLALACISIGSTVGTFSFQSDHVHFDAFTDNDCELVRRFRGSYTKYFNRKYSRMGKLGEDSFFSQEITGPRHIEAAESYILRNAVHHGICATPFGYTFNSAGCYFKKDLNHQYLANIDFSQYSYGQFLPKNGRPAKILWLNKQGILKPESFIEIAMTEKFFGSARAFNYCMTRFSSEEWLENQRKDENNIAPVSLETIERKSSSQTFEEMLENEKGRKYDNMLTDIQLCKIIDKEFLPKMEADSFAVLSVKQKKRIFVQLISRHDCSRQQILRCLALDPELV